MFRILLTAFPLTLSVLVFSVQKPHHSSLSIKENILLELKIALCMGKICMD